MLMSLQPRAWPEPAPEVAAAVRATYRRRQPPLPVTIRDRLGGAFPGGEVAPPVRARGPPGGSPGRVGRGPAGRALPGRAVRRRVRRARPTGLVAGPVGAGHGAADGREPDRPAGR